MFKQPKYICIIIIVCLHYLITTGEALTFNNLKKRFSLMLSSFCNSPIAEKRIKLEQFKLEFANGQLGFQVLERNLTIVRTNDCRNDRPVKFCPSKPVLRFLPNNFPSFIIEQECTCDTCDGSGSHRCEVMFEFEKVLILDKKKCVWNRALRKKVIGCQCVTKRNLEAF